MILRRSSVRVAILLLAGAIAASIDLAGAATRPAPRTRDVMVAGPEPLAVEEALKVLREGGNAVDAAVTMGFVLAVTYPRAGNIGGGGFMLIHTAEGENVFIDYRETAPASAAQDMFLDESGEPIPGESTRTYRAVGVPGTVAGLALALERHGTVPLRRTLEPAIRLAREGITVSRSLEEDFSRWEKHIERFPASRAIFLPGGRPLREGDRLVQRDLAATLSLLADKGPEAFYRGAIAGRLEEDMIRHGGLIRREDLAAYRPVVRKPLIGSYRGHTIVSAPPPSSGGVALMQILNMLEPYDLESLGHNSSSYIHLVAEAMKRAFADRSRWLGDPEFFDVPVEGLLSRQHARSLMQSFEPHRATPSSEAGPGAPPRHESESTTHYSIIDDRGVAVSNTYTLNSRFGCGAVAEGLGFVLNNEMDDFSIKAGVPNIAGLLGDEANRIEPGKRMLSSMTPTFVLQNSSRGPRMSLLLGSPGGPSIISSVLQALLNVIDFRMELQAAIDAPRFHHQWQPDRLFLDEGVFPRDVIRALEEIGHDVRERRTRGNIQAIRVDEENGWIYGASDARGSGVARGH